MKAGEYVPTALVSSASERQPKVRVHVGILAFAIAFCPPLNRVTIGAPPTTQRHWQYASLLITTRLSKWTSPDGDFLEEGDRGYAKLYADLGGKKPPEKVSTIDLLNLVGEQGWELVTVDGGEGPHQYIFKRTAQ